MDHKLSVLVQVDLDGNSVRLVVTGCLTEANQHVLHPLVRRAGTLLPPVAVSIDLTGADHVEAAGVDLLRRVLDAGQTPAGGAPAELVLPRDLPVHRHARHPGGRPLETSKWTL